MINTESKAINENLVAKRHIGSQKIRTLFIQRFSQREQSLLSKPFFSFNINDFIKDACLSRISLIDRP